ncbi:MAG TPA: hypothetical protein PK156_50090, partial [Polyangium sp.]|nr:hypothetical protein [Polyangium sp.]
MTRALVCALKCPVRLQKLLGPVVFSLLLSACASSGPDKPCPQVATAPAITAEAPRTAKPTEAPVPVSEPAKP